MAKLGNVMRAYIKPTASNYTWLTGEQSNNVNLTADAIEVSDKSTDWRQYIAGAKSGTIQIVVFADNADTVQAETLAAFRAGQEIDGFIGQLGTGDSPTDGDVFNGIVTSVSDTNDFGAVSTRTIGIQLSGAPTHYPA